MEHGDKQLKDDTSFLSNRFITDGQVFLVDFVNQKTREPRGFSKVTASVKISSKPHYHKRNWRKREEIEKKRKARARTILGRNQVKEKQKFLHRQKNSKTARIRSRYWSSYKYAVTLTHNRNLKPSVEVQPSWKTTHQFNYTDMLKWSHPLSRIEVSEIMRTGKVQVYNHKVYENVAPKRKKSIDKSIWSKYVFPNIRPVHDPMLIKLAKQKKGNVFLSSKILGVIMASCRSIHSWDLTFKKRNNVIFVDHRVKSRITDITVDEQSGKSPTLAEKRKRELNSAFRLKWERTKLNQMFSQQVLKPAETEDGYDIPQNYEIWGDFKPPVKVEGKRKLPNKGLVYRKFELGKGLNVVVRCEVDTLIKKDGRTSRALNRAVHEYQMKKSGQWSKLLETVPGTVIINEVNNNSFEFARWIFEALLVGADYLNIGFLTRDKMKSDQAHSVLKVESYSTRNFAEQFIVKLSNGWAIFKRVIDSIMGKPDGDYVLLKIPNKQCLCAYQSFQTKKQPKRKPKKQPKKEDEKSDVKETKAEEEKKEEKPTPEKTEGM